MVRHTGVLWCMLIYQMYMGTGKLVDGTTTNIIPLGERKYRASPPVFHQHGRETPGYSMRSIDRKANRITPRGRLGPQAPGAPPPSNALG